MVKALIRNLVTSFRAPAKMLDNSHSHPHPQRDNDDSFIMINQDGNTTRPTTPTKTTETPERESPVPNPLFTSPTDTTDALRGSYPEDLIDEQDLVDGNQENPMNKPLEDKINDTIFAWSWTDTADAHATATAADLDDAGSVTSPESHSADLDQGTPMDIDPKPDENYSPMARVFGLLNMWTGTNNVSSNSSKTESAKLDTISEEENESMDTSTEPSENTSPNLNFAAPVNSPTDSALGAPMTAINSRTMQMSTFQLNQNISYHTTPSGTAPPSYQTSPHLLPDFSQDTMQTIQPTSLLDDVSENPTTLTESASTITLTQDSFSAAINDEKQKMTELPPNPRPWGWNKPTTFLCLPQRLRQAIMINTVSTKDFHVRRLRVSGDYYEAFVFDEKVQTWGRVLKAVDERLAGDMKGVRRGWKKMGLVVRKEKIRKMGWMEMVGSGWNGSFR